MATDELMQTAAEIIPGPAVLGARIGAAAKRTRIQRVLLVLPAWNEAGKIGATIAKVPAGVVETVLVVDDGSTDQTAAEAEALGAVVICHPHNLGVGAAIRTGIYYARDEGYDVVVVAASDDQDVPSEIPRLLEPIEQGRAEFVQGSRYRRGGKRVQHPLSRTVLTWSYSALFTLLAFHRVTDGTNGFRAFLTRTALALPLEQTWLNRYELEPYLYFRCVQQSEARQAGRKRAML